MFGYVSDDHTWVHVELRQQQQQTAMKRRDSMAAVQMMSRAKSYTSFEQSEKELLEESVVETEVPFRRLKEDYLNVNGFFGDDGGEV